MLLKIMITLVLIGLALLLFGGKFFPSKKAKPQTLQKDPRTGRYRPSDTDKAA